MSRKVEWFLDNVVLTSLMGLAGLSVIGGFTYLLYRYSEYSTVIITWIFIVVACWLAGLLIRLVLGR